MAVLALRTYGEFDRTRVRVVTAPVSARDAVVVVDLPDLTTLAGRPVAFVMRLRGAGEATDVSIALDGTALAQTTIAPGGAVRVDATANVSGGSGHRLVLRGERAGWQLLYMEAANVYGFSSGVLSFVIVPRGYPHDAVFPAWLALAIGVALLMVRPRTSWPGSRARRVVHRTVMVAMGALFLVVLAADTLTRYKVLLSVSTWLLCVAVLYAEPLARVWRVAEPHVLIALQHAGIAARRMAPFTPYLVIPAMFVWAVSQFYAPGVGFTRLIEFGAKFVEFEHPRLRAVPHALAPDAGYDGQFHAQLALDPLLRSEEIRTSVDAPGYRGRRILFSWVAYVLGAGRPTIVLQAYALLNVASWFVLAWLLLRWLPPGRPRAAAAWVGCLLGEGMMVSVRKSLLDGPSMVLLTLAIIATESGRRGVAAGVIGAAALGRDTNLLGAVVLPRRTGAPQRIASLALQVALVLVPLAVWVAYLSSLGLAPVEPGHANFGLPLTAYVGKWATTLGELRTENWLLPARTSLLSLVALTTQAVVLVRWWQPGSPWWRMGIAYVALLIVLGYEVWNGYPGAAARVVMPMTFAFNVLLPRARWFWPLWALGNVNVLDGLVVMGILRFEK